MQQIAFSDVINVNRQAFLKKLVEVSARIQIHPSWLMVVFKIESGFNRKALNRSSGAVGLMQWIPKFARPALMKMGKATKHTPDWVIQRTIQNMSGVEQLELAGIFLEQYKGRMTDMYQTYMAVFWPAALGKPNHYIIGKANDPGIKGKAYRWNKYLDTKYGDSDGDIEVSEVKNFVNSFAKLGGVPIPGKTSVKNELRKICPTCHRPY